ncbi:MAG: hypothetical protein QOE93_101 [Actinomycetota bacterium]|nr:hypothetical protein [Actinomycetota bacterium]
MRSAAVTPSDRDRGSGPDDPSSTPTSDGQTNRAGWP